MIDVWKDDYRRWWWKICDDQGRLLMKSTECYITERAARRAAEGACDLIVNADIEDGLDDLDPIDVDDVDDEIGVEGAEG